MNKSFAKTMIAAALGVLVVEIAMAKTPLRDLLK